MPGEDTPRAAAAGSALWRYHEATKHSRLSISTSLHRLDWSNKPLPFKIYTSLEGVPPPDDVARLCRYSNGVLRWRRYPHGEEHGFRAAACTGALYHVELYLASAEREDLPAGLYQYAAHDHTLRRLRRGDVRGALVEASGGFAPLASAPLIVALTSTFWRNSWKYEARAYRHAFWDSGVILANLLALASADAQPVSVVMGFADEAVNRLLGVDGVREAAVGLVAVGDGAAVAEAPGALPALDLPTVPLSPREVRYPAIEEAHRASSLPSSEAAAAWRAAARAVSREMPAALSDLPIENVIRRRRSTRRFADLPITRAELGAALAAATAPIPGDAFGAELVEPFLIVNAVEGLAPGAYRSDLTPFRRGDLRDAAADLALWQDLGAEAAADVYFLADLDAALARSGERGYRVAQTAGAIAGGRMELAATAAGLGATGLTFFDDEVTRFFEPAAAGRQVMYLAALGRRVGTRR